MRDSGIVRPGDKDRPLLRVRRASLAVGHTILQAAYHMIQRHQSYIELGANYLVSLDKAQLAKRLVKRLEGLGFVVEAKQTLISPSLSTA